MHAIGTPTVGIKTEGEWNVVIVDTPNSGEVIVAILTAMTKSVIPSWTEEKFSFKHRQSNKTISVLLEHGSLLLMKDATQKNWLHCLSKSSKITLPRINLTL